MSKKKEFAVSYQIQYGSSCVFRQTINLTRKTFNKLHNALIDQRADNENKRSKAGFDSYFALHLAATIDKTDCMIFFNHTQRDFFEKYIGQYLKKPLLDRNTCFCLID